MLTLTQLLFHIAHIATASVWLSAGLADICVCLKKYRRPDLSSDQYLQSPPEAIGSWDQKNKKRKKKS